MTKTLSFFICAMTLAACSPAANGGGSSGGDDNNGGGPGGGQKPPGDGNGGNPDNNPPPGPTTPPLVQGMVAPVAATTDGKVLYVSGDQTQSLSLVDVASGKTTVLAQTIAKTDSVLVQGNVVAFWTGVDANTGIGAFHTYTSANGVKDGDTKSVAGLFGASDDGSRIVYTTAATSTPTMTLTIAGADLSTPTTVVANVGVGTSTKRCLPTFGFVGTRLLAAACTGTATTATVHAIEADGTAVTVLTSAQSFWAADKAGDKVLVISSVGSASVHSLPDNKSTTIDTGVGFGALSDDGSTVLYRAGTALKRSSTSVPAPQTVVAQGVRGLLTVSTDLAWVMAFSNAPDTQNQAVERYDIQLADAKNPGALSALLAATTGTPIGFTATNSHAVYMTDLPLSGVVGSLRAKPLAGGAEVELAKDAFLPQIMESGARVLYQANLKASGNSAVGDILVHDLASGKDAKAIVGAVDAGYISDGKNVYYTMGDKGLFSSAIP
jgi:hypothetical protein